MRCLLTAPALALLLVPAAAHGAAVQTDRTCYLQTDKTNVTVSGNGYTPGRPYSVLLDGTALTGGLGAIDAGGAMRGAFSPPMLADDELERTFTRAGRLRRADRQLDVHRHASEGELHAVLGRPQEAARALLGRRLRPRHAQPRRLRPLHRAGRQAQADDPARQGDRASAAASPRPPSAASSPSPRPSSASGSCSSTRPSPSPRA